VGEESPNPPTERLEAEILLALLGCGQGLTLLRNNGQTFGAFSVQLEPLSLIIGELSFIVDGFDRTLWDASATVDALLRVDIEHLVIAVETLHRANCHAVGEPASFAIPSYDESHGPLLAATFATGKYQGTNIRHQCYTLRNGRTSPAPSRMTLGSSPVRSMMVVGMVPPGPASKTKARPLKSRSISAGSA
jgi:hypothetical protein